MILEIVVVGFAVAAIGYAVAGSSSPKPVVVPVPSDLDLSKVCTFTGDVSVDELPDVPPLNLRTMVKAALAMSNDPVALRALADAVDKCGAKKLAAQLRSKAAKASESPPPGVILPGSTVPLPTMRPDWWLGPWPPAAPGMPMPIPTSTDFDFSKLPTERPAWWPPSPFPWVTKTVATAGRFSGDGDFDPES